MGAITLDAKVIVLAAPRALIVVLATGSGQVVRVVRAQVRATASAWSSHPLVLPEASRSPSDHDRPLRPGSTQDTRRAEAPDAPSNVELAPLVPALW